MALNNSQYDQIMRDYQARQLQRQRLITQRQQEIHQQTPELQRINDAITDISIQSGKKLLMGDHTATRGLEAQIQQLSQQRSALLTRLGYPADYLTPPYTCADCQDTGYIDGKTRCHCFTQAAIDLVYKQSHLSKILEKENFDTFSFSYYSPDHIDSTSSVSSLDAAKNAYERCQQFVQNFNTDFENIYLFGNTGVGKTFLTHCIAKELLDTGHSVVYFSAHQLFDTLAAHLFDRESHSHAEYQNIFDCDLLIIDDLGTEMSNAFTLSEFFICLNERILKRKSTIISSNLGLMELASSYSERVFSRISDSYILLNLFGEDIRIAKKLAGI